MHRLADRRVLVVEDDVLIAMDIEQLLLEADCKVYGPVSHVADALRLLEKVHDLDAALLDVNLGSEQVYPVADFLDDAGVPFVLLTGHTMRPVPQRHKKRPLITKPYRPNRVLAALVTAMQTTRQPVASSATAGQTP
jgi:two-component SAPR family response regulator